MAVAEEVEEAFRWDHRPAWPALVIETGSICVPQVPMPVAIGAPHVIV